MPSPSQDSKHKTYLYQIWLQSTKLKFEIIAKNIKQMQGVQLEEFR